MSKTQVAFNVRVPATLATKVRTIAKNRRQTLKVIVVEALEDLVEKESNGQTG